ncbi:hypothetical protein CEY16_08090 [Halalkalibacillus sediminis]|uniref:DUF2188 domain-containing protein n=1 Tax=Halalkalibacillus sediminis TaxID=2018042 RepID=A0A2I0QU94_9BACI|nr:DUF2188 domain-containing protein [Halalkalibacillus sediminis]PKR77879.1 hypothetical protein CEY16_08090 [Halalkalibacillus sediminis]
MPWDTNDYPSSLKNLNEATRNKAIEIANAMLEDGYTEGQAIPIATSQAKEWYEEADSSERKEMRNTEDQELKEHDEEDLGGRPELLDHGVMVKPHEDGWAVETIGAKQPSDVYDNKDEAVDRAKEIAKNKDTYVQVRNKDGDVQRNYSYDE